MGVRFAAYKQFCDDTTEEKKASIAAALDLIESLQAELFPSWLLGCRSRASSKRHEAILCFLGSQRGNPWTQCCVIDIAAGFRRRFFFADMSSVEKLWTTARRSVADFGR